MRSVRLQEKLAGQAQQPDPATPTLSEVFPDTATDAAAVGYLLARLPRKEAPVLWVQDRLSRKESGRPYLAGMATGAAAPPAIILVDLSRAQDVLWAMEEGLRCRALRAVVGEVWGDPPALDFTATKRLALRSEAAQVPCWLVRRAGAANLSAARDRWRIASAPSAPNPHDAQAPGLPRWSLDLFRSRRLKPGQWVAEHDRTADRLYRVAASGDGALAAGDGAQRERATG
ncbi:ImuA family protein [Thalassorhabdomicrobium marinisediminis]|uniref:Protein ImuA n=1 Tax=Thalassorhabdomicrobium marinisediminis TaxID=2170577 RepID=A0A2T7FYI9_9RHOB|nr:hypothetical protein [Thalassorhabdomicrobium marinisediminis]PVA07236.1 hypothetical protein DC363_05145 [Thalassorhabdomicrobium marinisediminis]